MAGQRSDAEQATQNLTAAVGVEQRLAVSHGPFPCIRAARRFDASRHVVFDIAGIRVGWIRRSDLARLHAWRHVFDIDDARVALRAEFDTVDARTRVLGEVIGALAAEGCIPGWRNETYAIRNHFDDAPLAYIERAASRFFGTQTFAVHLNGVVFGRAGTPVGDVIGVSDVIGAADAPRGASGQLSEAARETTRMWIARRSLQKATDPGMLDNLVGGGIGWGYGIEETLIKECWEESGIPDSLARRAVRGGTIHVLQEIEEGTQAEQLFIFDLDVGADFEPQNQDGEVADHRLAAIDDVLQWIQQGRMTVDASLAALDWMSRHGALSEGARAELAALSNAPV
jgi:8-oxo-dGTP pyrophosphatase MutT (NUDIX family)